MSEWLVIFLLSFTAFLCIACTFVGAHIMHCKQAQVSPVESLPPLRNLIVPGTKHVSGIDEKDILGYYD